MLNDAVGAMLRTPVPQPFATLATEIAGRLRADAVLFYGSSLRTGDREGVADFYSLEDGPATRGGAWRWPIVSYHEIAIEGVVLRAKVARMTLADFARAARGATADTTVWTRFAQPARLVYARDEFTARRVQSAVADCIATAGRFAAALGPESGTPAAYWLALFRETYGAEFRIEKVSRAQAILDNDPDHYRRMLPLAWIAEGLIAEDGEGELQPLLPAAGRRQWLRSWRWRKRLGKPLNIVRLLRAVFTFDGAARYALWKIERHSGLHIPVTPWRERHPILAAPGVLFKLWRNSRA